MATSGVLESKATHYDLQYVLPGPILLKNRSSAKEGASERKKLPSCHCSLANLDTDRQMITTITMHLCCQLCSERWVKKT